MPPKLTQEQKNKLKIYEPKLRRAVELGNYSFAKEITLDIQKLLRPTGHETRLMKAKCWMYEAALEAGKLDTAKRGLEGVRLKLNNNTRVYLEATSLLAIVLLRKGDLSDAEPLMREVLKNDNVIKSERRNREFRFNIIKRFEEEATLASFKGQYVETLDAEEIQNEAGELVLSLGDIELYERIGKACPPKTREYILKVNEFSRKQLPPADIKLLPSPKDRIKDKNVGITVFQAAKIALWKALCDPQSDIYQFVIKRGLNSLYNTFSLSGAITQSLLALNIGSKTIAVAVTALIIRFGITIYCEKYRPQGIMIR